MRPLLAHAILALSLPHVGAQKLAVYVLAGQSNMQGHAKVETFDYIGEDPATAPWLDEMRGPDGAPTVCDDVWISYLTNGRGGDGVATGRLTAGYGARNDPAKDGGRIGPEFTFGLEMAKAHDGPVLLIKTAWGGKSLHTDFRSPSAGPYAYHPKTLERLQQQDKDIDALQADRAARTGVYYRKMIDHVRRVLAAPGEVCSGYDPAEGYELRGFVWFQGWNDMVDRETYPDRDKPGGYDQYSECMAHFIRDVRADLKAPAMPFVIGVMGVGGAIQPGAPYSDVHGNFRAAMAAPAALDELKGNTAAVQTAPYWCEELEEISEKMNQVRHLARMLSRQHKDHANKDGEMSKEEQRAHVDAYRDELVGAEDLARLQRGSSNAAYHYLGAAKTMAGIGRAFAAAALAMQR